MREIDLPEVKSVVSVIRDADETGASIAKALKSKAEQIRFERFARAEEGRCQSFTKNPYPNDDIYYTSCFYYHVCAGYFSIYERKLKSAKAYP